MDVVQLSLYQMVEGVLPLSMEFDPLLNSFV